MVQQAGHQVRLVAAALLVTAKTDAPRAEGGGTSRPGYRLLPFLCVLRPRTANSPKSSTRFPLTA